MSENPAFKGISDRCRKLQLKLEEKPDGSFTVRSFNGTIGSFSSLAAINAHLERLSPYPLGDMEHDAF